MSRKATSKATSKDKPKGRGGKREGAGRPRKYDEPVETRAINLPPTAWARVDALRGSLSESDWFFGQILHADLR